MQQLLEPVSHGSTPAAKLVVSDLKIGGGANLFTHEDFGDGEIYDADQPEFCGLRDYPILKSPNVAEVTVASLNIGVTAAGDITHQFSCALLCEVLQDDNYGSHITSWCWTLVRPLCSLWCNGS